MSEFEQASEATDTSAPAQDSAPVTETPMQEAGDTSATPTETPKYTPNYKFKYASKESHDPLEGEFDEFIRPAIKDAETEKQIRSLYEKARGLDFVHPHYKETRESFKTLKSEHDQITQELKELGGSIRDGNLDKTFSTLGISEDLLFKYVADKLEYKQLPPEEKQRMERERQIEEQKYAAENQVGTLQAQYNSTAVQLRGMQLEMGLGNSEYSPMIEAFDSRRGKGAFKNRVIKYGSDAFASTGKDLTVEEAIAGVIQEYEPFINQTAPQEPQQFSQKKPPVIPNISGRNTVPTSKSITSIDDIKKRYHELRELENND